MIVSVPRIPRARVFHRLRKARRIAEGVIFETSRVHFRDLNLLWIYLTRKSIRPENLAPIHSHYKDFLDLRGDGRVVLYKRADHQNPKWTVRLKIPETEGFVVKSTKTTDDFAARRFAEDLYYRLEGKARRGEPINSPTFRKVFSEWSKVPVAEQVVRSIRYVNGNVRRVEIWALQYFADVTIDRVTESPSRTNGTPSGSS
jgi:hypothetical protein